MTVLDQLLAKVPTKVRYTLYVLAALGLLGYSAIQAAEGDYKKAVGIFFGSLLGAMAATSTGRTGLTKV